MYFKELLANLGIHLNVEALSLGAVLRVLILALAGVICIRILMKLVDQMLGKSKALFPLRIYIRTAIRVVLWFVLVLVLAESLGIHTASIIALLSVAGLAVSLALQNTLSNLAGGIMLLVTRPFQVGDYVEADGVGGTISVIGLAYTTFITIDNKIILLPNSQLSATKITNYTALGKRRVDMTFRASYDAPTQAVKQAIQEVLDTIPQLMTDPAPEIRLAEYQASSIRYLVRVWTATTDYWTVYYAVMEGVRDSFARHGVQMTYNHLNVHLLEK